MKSLSPKATLPRVKRLVSIPQETLAAEIPGLHARVVLLIIFVIIALEGFIAVIDNRYLGVFPTSYLYILPVLIGALYLGYLGGIGAALLSVALFHIVHLNIGRQPIREVDLLQLIMLILLGVVTSRIQSDRRRARRYVRTLEKLNRDREELTALIVHDLKTPLAGIINLLNLLQDEDTSLPRANREELLGLAVSSGEEMLGMIGDLLMLYSKELRALELHRRELQPRELIDGAIKQIIPLAQARDLKITVNLADDLPDFSGDESLLRRVLVNLLGNALRFAPKGSTIQVAGTRAGGEITFRVTDEGSGIPDFLKEKIFEKFSSADPEVSKHISTGLGLAFAKMAVEAHGGQIWVDSPCLAAKEGPFASPGRQASRGSCFSFHLPLISSPALNSPAGER
jgi:signal transduction histidine kinase